METRKSEILAQSPLFIRPVSESLIASELPEALERRALSFLLKNTFDKIGEFSLEEAIHKGLISDSEKNNLYDKLSNFIEQDENNVRLILYLPFQIFPNAKNENSKEANRFKKTLRNGFIRLLYEDEVRANFVDGDVLEPGLGVPPRIRKIAHLSSEFLEKGILYTNDLFDLLDIAKEQILINSLVEGLIVAHDKALITPTMWSKFVDLAKSKNAGKLFDLEPKGISNYESSEDILSDFNNSLQAVENKYSPDSIYIKSISKKRAVWEKSMVIDEIIENTATKIAEKIINKQIDPKEVMQLSGRLAIRSLVRTLEKSSLERINIENYLPFFEYTFIHGDSHEKEEVRNGVSHLYKLQAIPDGLLKKYFSDLPDFSKITPVNLEEFIKNDGRLFVEAANKIKRHAILSNYIYPFFLVLGSRIKGYADHDGDFDAAIFIKPETPLEIRETILDLLKKDIPEVQKMDSILEYWVEEKNDGFDFRFFENKPSKSILNNEQIHFIFGGVWVGSSQNMQKIYKDLSARYLNPKEAGQKISKEILVKQLEMDILQCRLMHKGYKKHYPANKDKGPLHGNLIDWKSDFWDRGYRRLATQLFVNKVFLPSNF